jgi:6-phosphogluconolactonase (cycloisomerase 2 family)
MTMRVRGFLMLIVGLALIGLASCDHYVCGTGPLLGETSCTPSAPGLGGGTGPTASAAFAYVVDQGGTMDGFGVDTTAGTFTALSSYTAPAIPNADPSTGVVVAQSQFLYAAFFTTGQIYGWSIDGTTGALTAISGSPFPASYLGFVGFSGYNQTSMITNPAGTLLFVADAGNAEIWVYQIGSTGTLTLAPGSPFSTGTFQPWNLTTDGLGKYLYSTFAIGLHQGLTVAAYSIGSTGTLTAVTGSPFTAAPAPGIWAVAGEPSGQYLIGISGETLATGAAADDDHLYVFNIQQSGSNAGALLLPGTAYSTIYAPFNIAVQPNSSNGEFVYSFSENDSGIGYNGVEGYSLNTTTGALSAITNSPFSNLTTAAIWGQFDQSGDFLFFYGDSGSVELGVLNAAPSTGQLTDTLSTVPLATTGYWAVTDPQ